MEKFFVPSEYQIGRFRMFNMWILWQSLTCNYARYGHENPQGIDGNETL